MKSIMAIIVFAVLGCEEPEKLYVDTHCSVEQRQMIDLAAEKLNTVVGYDAVVIDGTKNIDHSKDVYNDGLDAIMCEWPGQPLLHESLYGFTVKRDIVIANGLTREQFLSVAMHELAHFMGVEGHVGGGGNVMSSELSDPPVVEYTDADIEFIEMSIEYQ